MMFDRATLSRVAIGVLTVAALTYGWMTSYPDNVNMSYGLPLTWGVHQLITIAGPVDTWRVDMSALLIDLVVWVALLIVVPMYVGKAKGA
ncbi:MAG TPA: hypothetical protein VGB32_05010 [Candidatus Bathyarchaeia archaeon]